VLGAQSRSGSKHESGKKPLADTVPLIDVQSFINSRKIGAFQYRVVALCALTVFLDGFDTQSIAFVLKSIATEFSIPPSHFGPIISAGLVGLGIGSLVFGPVADKIGRRTVVMIATAVFGLFTLLAANATNETALVAFRFLAGLGFGGAMPNAIALTAEYCPERRRATLVMIMFTGFSFGAAAAGSLAAAVIPHYGWRTVWYVGGILPLVLLPLQYLWLPESIRFLVVVRGARERVAALIRRLAPADAPTANARFVISEAAAPGVPVKHLFRGGRAVGTICLWIMFFMNLLALFLVQSWVPIIIGANGIPQTTAVEVAALFQWGGTLAAIVIGFAIDRFGGSRVLPFLYALGCAFVLTLGQTSMVVSSLMAVTFAAGFCIVGGQNSANAFAAIFYPTAMRASGVGWCLGIGRIGAIIGPLIGGYLFSLNWPNGWVFATAAIPLALAAIAVIVMGQSYGWSRVSEPATETAPPRRAA
jgi:MFS transporter, AAHS family, 4-hydroxybenzoate transporter